MTNLLLRGAGILLAVAPLCNLMLGQPNCTQANVVGTYAVSSQGTMIMRPAGASQDVGVPGVSVGLISVDWQGNITGTGVTSMSGEITKGPNPGTITVNSDCTGEVKWAWGARSLVAILNAGDELRGVMVETSMGKPVWLGTWRRISTAPSTTNPEPCTGSEVLGKYVYSYQGLILVDVPGAAQPVPAQMVLGGIGSVNFDGTVTGPGVGSMAGEIVDFDMMDAKLKVNTDCSLTDEFGVKIAGAAASGQSKEWGVVLDGGNEVWTILTQGALGKAVMLGNWKRISTTPFVESPAEPTAAQRMRK